MRKYIGLVAAAALAVSLSVGVATASAGGGNSANAKQCQKGGWMSLAGTNGPFPTQCAGFCHANGNFSRFFSGSGTIDFGVGFGTKSYVPPTIVTGSLVLLNYP